MIFHFRTQVSELPMVLRAMIDFDQNGAGVGVSLMNPVEQFSSRFRSRLHNKSGMLLQPPSPNPSEYISSSSPRSTYGIGELNRRITDLKVDHPALSPPHNFMRDSSPKLLELGQNYPQNNPSHYQPTQTTLQYNQQLNQQIRRDSNNSTTSSSYYSMKSCDVSRRSSNQSHTSSVSTIRPSVNAANYQNYDSNYFYDPISAGSSRRSSQLSTADNNNYGPPSSQLLSSHLARLQQRHSMSSSSSTIANSLAAATAAQTSHHYNPVVSAAAAFYQQHPHLYSYNPYVNSGANSQGNGNVGGAQQHPQQPTHMFYQNYPTMPSSQNYSPIHPANHVYNNNNARAQIPTSSTDRRMSEPISNASRNVQNDFPRSIQRPRSTTPTKSLEMLLEAKKEQTKQQQQKPKHEKSEEKGSPSKPHPNETVVLDVLKTNEKIENCDELVIPDDMVQFITNCVGDEVKVCAKSENVKPKKLNLDEIEPMSSSISIEKIKEEDLYTLLAEVDVDVKSNDEEENSSNNNNNNNNDNDLEFNVTASINLSSSLLNDDIEINNNSNSNNNNNVSNGNDDDKDCKIESDTSKAQQILCKS